MRSHKGKWKQRRKQRQMAGLVARLNARAAAIQHHSDGIMAFLEAFDGTAHFRALADAAEQDNARLMRDEDEDVKLHVVNIYVAGLEPREPL